MRRTAGEAESICRSVKRLQGTLDLSRVRCRHAHSGRLRGLGRVWLWHGALLGVRHHLRTSGDAFPFVLERLSNSPARPQEPSPLSRVRPVASKRCRHAHSGRLRGLGRWGFRMARFWGCATTCVPAAIRTLTLAYTSAMFFLAIAGFAFAFWAHETFRDSGQVLKAQV